MTRNKSTFDPNRSPVQVCIDRVDSALKKVGLTRNEVITSKHPKAEALRLALGTDNLPDGPIRKWQLPFILKCEAVSFFVTVAEAGAKVPTHSHDQGDGMRFVAGGSMLFNGEKFNVGDWIFLPKGSPYNYESGPLGTIIISGYCC